MEKPINGRSLRDLPHLTHMSVYPFRIFYCLSGKHISNQVKYMQLIKRILFVLGFMPLILCLPALYISSLQGFVELFPFVWLAALVISISLARGDRDMLMLCWLIPVAFAPDIILWLFGQLIAGRR